MVVGPGIQARVSFFGKLARRSFLLEFLCHHARDYDRQILIGSRRPVLLTGINKDRLII